jgi:hypothetical protein
MSIIVWTEYLQYRAELRGFDPTRLERIIRHSSERCVVSDTKRMIVDGRRSMRLAMIPYEVDVDNIIPETVHPITRLQIRFRF